MLKPARLGASPLTRRTTNPDCPSRVSTLQSAHLPVRGQVDLRGVLLPAAAGESAPSLAIVELEAAESAGCREERPHAKRAAKASRNALRRFVIEIQR